MKVYQIPVGPMQNFSYIVEDESTHEAIIIDPSWDLEKLTEIINEQNLNPKYIVNTHWHDDHTRGNEELAKELSVKVVQHSTSQLKNDLTVSDGDSIKFGCSEFAVYHTPGHSKDSICLVGDGKIFSGDTLAKRKPDTMPLLYCDENFKLKPEDCLMLGDSVSDVKAARAAGFDIICMSYGYNHGNDIGDENPDLVIDSMSQLSDHL